MELSDPATPSTDAINRRKSGRTKQKPLLYQQDPNIPIVSNRSGKRKRAESIIVDANDVDNVDDSEEESITDESDGDPDEEELKEKRRTEAKAKTAPTRPPTKKPKKTPSTTTNLPMRPATNGVKKVSKPRKPRAKPRNDSIAETDEDGLFGELAASS